MLCKAALPELPALPFHHAATSPNRSRKIFGGVKPPALSRYWQSSPSRRASRMRPKAKAKLPSAGGAAAPGPASCMGADSYCNASLGPAKQDPPKHLAEVVLPPTRPVSARCGGNRFRSPIKCLPSELHGWLPSFLAPGSGNPWPYIAHGRLKQNMRLFGAFKARMCPGKIPDRCGPICSPLGKNSGVKWGVWVV